MNYPKVHTGVNGAWMTAYKVRAKMSLHVHELSIMYSMSVYIKTIYTGCLKKTAMEIQQAVVHRKRG